MLTPDQFKNLSQIKPWKNLVDITLTWVIIGCSLTLCHMSLWFLPLALPLIVGRLQGLIVFMHDGSHYLIHKNQKVNDFISNVFCSFPLQLSTEAYRQTHFKHHQHTQTYKDPNFVIMRNSPGWNFPKPKAEVKKLLIKDFFFMTLQDHLIILKEWQVLPHFKTITTLEKVLFPLFVITTLGAVSHFGLWREFCIFQVATLLMSPIARLRAMSEHVHVEAQDQSKHQKFAETTTINANFIERFFISPFNSSRHLEHHTYPTVPYYNLEKTHDLIKESDFYKAHCRYELDGYVMGKRTSLNEVLSLTSDGKHPHYLNIEEKKAA